MNFIRLVESQSHKLKQAALKTFVIQTHYRFSQKIIKTESSKPVANDDFKLEQSQSLTKQQVLKTYLQIIPPYRLQSILRPQITDLTQFIQKPEGTALTVFQSQQLLKKMKKYVHTIPIQTLNQVLQVISPRQNQSSQTRIINRKIYTKILSTVHRKIDVLTIEQLVDFMYKLVKLNYKEFQFMKEVQKIIIQQKIKINYPLIRKILWSFTHLDVGSAVLYSHISKTLKIGQHQFSPLQLAESAYMLSKISQNATGGYGIFLIAQTHLLAHFPRLDFHQLTKAASYMLTQNIGTNQFQTAMEAELYKKYPQHSKFRINDLVTLLKSTSGYYFKFKEKALLNLLQTSTRKLAPQANLQQFEDIVWSWGRAGKGDRELWDVLQQQISRKYLKLLKPRQLSFFYFSLCSTQYSSSQAIRLLQKRFIQVVKQNPNINQHYLLKFLLGMQKRKDYSQRSFVEVSKMITDRMQKLSIKQLITFAKIINQSDICYQNKQKMYDVEMSLLKACKTAIAQKIYMFRINQIVEILYMWIKLDVAGQSKQSQISNKFLQVLFSHIMNVTHEIPKSVFIKALFCFTIKDKYKQAIQMIVIMEQLMKFGPINYFFSPFQLPLAAYSVFHLVVNSGGKIQASQQLLGQLSAAMDKLNPVILNKFVRNGYQQCIRLKTKYYQNNSKPQQTNKSQSKSKRRK